MTPSRPNDDKQHQKPPAKNAGLADKIDQASLDTPRDLRDETARVGKPDSVSQLPDDLSPEEKAQAKAALAFLGEVRDEKRVSGQLPSTIGRYSIIRSLGRGGFAEVFLADDDELDRRVALKVPLFNSMMNDAGRQRFEREAKLAASLGHPQIVPVYEYGDLGPVRFIAFAWCDGPNLSDWVEDNGPVDFETAAKMVQQLAEAVQHAHQRGIVHRDLKPGNVLVDDSEESKGKPVWERLRITDFGLARNFESHDASLTQDGQLVGTPAYMAPEQAGSSAEVGAAADVWALGMMLFELLTGQLPFRKSDILSSIRAICDEPVPKAKKLRSEVPAGLDAIADLCLRKDSANRYESAHALAEDLRRWSNGEPVKAKPQSALSTFAMWTRRNPILAGSIGLTIASLAIGLGVSLWQRNVAIANLLEAQAQTARADGNLASAQELINEILKLEKQLGTQSHLAKERDSLVKRASKMQVALIEDEKQTPATRFSTAMTFKELSEVLTRLGSYEASVENSEYVLKQLEGLENDLPPNVTHEQIYRIRFQQRLMLSGALSTLKRLEQANECLLDNELEPIPEGSDPFQAAIFLAENSRGRAMVLTQLGDMEGATDAMSSGLEKLESVDPPENKPENKKMLWNWALMRCQLSMTLGSINKELKDWDSAETQLVAAKDGLVLMKEIFPNHPKVLVNEGIICFQLGSIYETRKNWPAAIEQYELCRTAQITMSEQNPKFVDPGNTYVYASVALARSHKENGSPEESKRIAQESIETSEAFPSQAKSTPGFEGNIKLLQGFAEQL